MRKFFVVCHVPITGEQYVREIDGRVALEEFMIEHHDEVGRVIEGFEHGVDDFFGGKALTPSDDQKHSISHKFVSAINAFEKGALPSALEEALAIIDQTEQDFPGDDRQRQFYAATRALVHRVATKAVV